MDPELQLFIGESHGLLQLCFWRAQDFRLLHQCWSQLRSEGDAFSLIKQSNRDQSVSLRVEFKARTNYIEGKKNDVTGLVTLNVAKDWLQDVIVLWSTVKPDDKVTSHEYIWSGKKGDRRSTPKGYRLEVAYGTRPRGIEQTYKLSRFLKPEPNES